MATIDGDNMSKEVQRKRLDWKSKEADFEKKLEREVKRLRDKLDKAAKKFVIVIVRVLVLRFCVSRAAGPDGPRPPLPYEAKQTRSCGINVVCESVCMYAIVLSAHVCMYTYCVFVMVCCVLYEHVLLNS